MINRIIGLIVCVLIMAVSMMFINLHTFSGYLVGIPMFALAFSVGLLIILDDLEQNGNVHTGKPVFDPEALKAAIERAQAEGQRDFAYINELNTPDPNLIHPDDLKRIQASAHDHYPKKD